MKKMTPCAVALACVLLLCSPLFAATFVVPPDRDLVRQATAIVIATPVASRTQLRHERIIETVTTIAIEDVLKGAVHRDSLEIHEPGGVYGNRVSTIPGVPQFADGERYILFLIRTDEGIWRVLNLVLGEFRIDRDPTGFEVAVRDSSAIAGWDPDGRPHREGNRAAHDFIDFIRATVNDEPANAEYMLPAPSQASASTFRPKVLSFAASTYTYDYSGTEGARWFTFPTATTFYSTGANTAAVTALNNAIASWNNDSLSNVNLAYGGADNSGTHTSGVATFDGQSTVAFERDLTAEYGAPGFSCSSTSYNGTLGIAAVTNNTGTGNDMFNGEAFFASSEGDVEMNKGLSTCTFFINLGDFNSAVAHELGHTLGFRHADQERNLFPGPAPSCSGDASVECSTSAIMKAFIPSTLNGNLQAWDQHAVDALYPAPACTSPSISSQPAGSTITSGGSAALSVTATGTAPLTYQWYLGVAPDTTNPIGGATTSTYNTGALTSTTSYWVRVSGCSTFVNSNTATVTVLGSPVNSGDVNGSGAVNSADVFYLINYLFAGGPAPVTGAGDPNNDGAKNAGDVIFLLRYLFASGTAPAPAH